MFKIVFKIHDILIKRILLLILGVCVALFMAANVYVYPLFTGVLVDYTEKEAVTIAEHIYSMILPPGSELFITHIVKEKWPRIEKMVEAFDLQKLKIFIANGETIFSTDPKDLGVINEHDYFYNKVAKGQVLTKLVRKDALSLEGQRYKMDVVETYVPILKEDRFIGALEIYHNISKPSSTISQTVTLLNIFSIFIIAVFLVVCLIVARKLDQNILDRKAANQFLKFTNLDLKDEITNRKEAEKAQLELINELEKTMLELRTLKGLVPICAFCKNIRNDSGYWEKMEQYIEAHSDAEFSHGLCPDCAKEQYPDLHLDEDDETYAKRNVQGDTPEEEIDNER